MTVSLLSVGTAVPRPRSQHEVGSFVLERFNIRERTRQLYKRVLANPSIETRHFAFDDFEQLLDQNHDQKNARFEREAARLGTSALESALRLAKLAAADVDFIATGTCTGYVCPGLSSHYIERAGLKSNVRVADLAGMGCGAAIPALEQAYNFVCANPGATAAVVCSEICSAALVSNDDADIVISNALFADGAAAVLLTGRETPGMPVIRGFSAHTIPQWRDSLRFVSENGHLKNTLKRDVPIQAAQALRKTVSDLNTDLESVHRWILHAGGQKVLDELAREFGLSESHLAHSRRVLRRYGNMSSPTVLFVLEDMLRTSPGRPGEKAVMASFGAGFSAYAAELEWI